jgi:hypothetical protein
MTLHLRMGKFTINYTYFFITAAAVVLSFELHELCHYITGELLGNKMVLTLNSGYPVSGYYLKDCSIQW